MSATRLSLLLSAVVPIAAAAAPTPAAPTPVVRDAAGLFRPETIREAEAIAGRIRAATRPPKSVIVETFDRLPEGVADLTAFGRAEFARRNVDGLLVVILEGRGLRVFAGRQTLERIGAEGRNAVADQLLQGFRAGRPDEALIAALRSAEQRLTAAFPATPAARAPPPTTEGPADWVSDWTAGYSWVGWVLVILAIALAVWLVIGIVRAVLARRSGGGGYGGPAPGGHGGPGGAGGWGAGGGFLTSLLGGLFGAAAGNWAYDALFRDHSHDQPAAGGETGAAGAGAAGGDAGGTDVIDMSDRGQVGEGEAGADFGGFGGADTGGDYGGGEFGGDDYAGGDFGGSQT